MAKKSVSNVIIDGTSYNLMIINDLTVIPTPVVSGYYTYEAPYYEEWACTHNTDFATVKSDATSSTCYDTDLKLAKFLRYRSGSYYGIGWSDANMTNYYSGDLIQYNGSSTHAYYSFVIDDDTQECWIINHEYQNDTYTQRGIMYDPSGSLYDAISKVTPPVPQGDATVKITYYLPNDDYEYAKIVYKQGERPNDVTDGQSVDISPTDTEVTIEGLFEHKNYWFAIFTDKNESEALDYLVNDYIPPEPEDPDIMLLSGGQLKRESLVESPYVNAEYYNTAIAELRSDGYYLEVSDSASTSHYASNATKYRVTLTQSQGTSGYKPLINTLCQESKTNYLAYNFVKIKCDVDITMPAGSGFSIRPYMFATPENSGVSRATSGKYLANLIEDKTHITDNIRINSDPNTSFTIKQSMEFELVYNNFKTESYEPSLQFNINCIGINPFTFKMKIKEIKVEMHKTIATRPTDEFYIAASSTSSGYKWTASEIYQFVKSLGYNAFVLEPKSSTYDSTRYWVIPLNITVPENMYVCKDYGITNANNYFAIGYETSETLTGLPTYCSTSTKTLEITSTTVGFTFSTTKDGHTYRYRRISYTSGRMSFVFYTEGYKHLYVNNVLVK